MAKFLFIRTNNVPNGEASNWNDLMGTTSPKYTDFIPYNGVGCTPDQGQ